MRRLQNKSFKGLTFLKSGAHKQTPANHELFVNVVCRPVFRELEEKRL